MRIRLSQSAEHQSDHANVQPRLGVGGLNFIMAHQAAMFHKPAEGPFDNPAFAQHSEATLVLQARHDLQPQGAYPAEKPTNTGLVIDLRPLRPDAHHRLVEPHGSSRTSAELRGGWEPPRSPARWSG